jgi:hypothetical protein
MIPKNPIADNFRLKCGNRRASEAEQAGEARLRRAFCFRMVGCLRYLERMELFFGAHSLDAREEFLRIIATSERKRQLTL